MKLDRISVATFNLLNLNEPGLPLYTDKDGWTPAQYDKKIAWTRDIINRLQPEVLGLQELWHGKSIATALKASAHKNDYDIVAPADANGKKIVCAALVKKGLLSSKPEWIKKFPDAFVLKSSGDDPQTPAISVNIKSFSRPVLHFTVTPREDSPPIHIYVCHFKSKGPTRVENETWFKDAPKTYAKHRDNLGAALSTIRRTAEASALRYILSEQMKGKDEPVVVLGDINDGQHSNTSNILTEQPKYLVGDSRGGGDSAFYTAQTLQEYRNTRDVYYTHIHQDVMESLDHILVSQELYDNSRKRLWIFDGMTVSNDHLNWEDHKESGTNDHGIICASFRYKPIKAEARAIVRA